METGLVINKLSNCLRRRSAAIQKSVGVSGAQGAILDYLVVETASGRPVCQRDIEREFGLRPSTATETLQAMEAAGLIRREADERDARRKNIVLPPQADGVRAALAREIEQTETLLVAGLTAEERAEFLRLGKKMLENLGGSSDER